MVKPEVIRKRFNKFDEYLDVDLIIVFDVLQTGLKDLQAIRTDLAVYL